MEDFLAVRTRATPGAPALLFEGRTWTYAELNAAVAGVCARLEAAGLDPRDRAGVLLGNVPAYVFLVHALIRMGAVIVPLNLRLTAGELAGQIERAAVDFLIHAETPVPGLLDAVSTVQKISSGALLVRRPEPDGHWTGRQIDPQKDWGILFTSGTTGTARGAVISLGAAHSAAEASAKRLGTHPDDRWLLAMPLYHVGGLSILFRACLNGAAVVLQDGFEPDAVLDALARDRVTLLSVVPTMLRRLLTHTPDRRPPQTLRLVLAGGAAAPEDLVIDALDRGWPVALTYGLTEAASQVTTALPEAVRSKPGSVGQPLFGTRLRIVSPETGEAMPAGEAGEVSIAGPTLMRAYLGDPPPGEWLATGDIGYLDGEGDLFILQRRTDLIVSGGENVYPAEVERVLLGHPDIREACVVGIEDREWGRIPAAAIVTADPALTAGDVEGYLRQRLAGYKLPREIRFVEKLPCTASGKVCRPDVAALFGS